MASVKTTVQGGRHTYGVISGHMTPFRQSPTHYWYAGGAVQVLVGGEQHKGLGFGILQLPIPAWTCRTVEAPAQEFRAGFLGQRGILVQESCRKIRFKHIGPIFQQAFTSGLVLLIKLY